MTIETRQKLFTWLSAYPDSTHPLDEARFHEFVYSACVNGDEIYYKDVYEALDYCQKQWADNKRVEFCEEKIVTIEQLMRFYRFCLSHKTKREFVNTFHDFMEECDPLNYHEIYDLAQALTGNTESLNFFSIEPIKSNEDAFVLSYPLTNTTMILNKQKAKDFLSWLETNYMDGLDAESWYGFEYAMEKAKDN